jgi:GTPase
MYQTQPNSGEPNQKEKALLVGVKLPYIDEFTLKDSLAELKLLAQTAGAEVITTVVQERKKLNPAFFIGKGKGEQLKQICDQEKIDVIIFDDDLSSAQIYNLEDKIGVKVIDRSCLILDIFAQRAKTKEAKTQVALAQLKYLLPRLTGRWAHFSRQYGGIGTKGPGEKQLEVDRRQTRKKIKDLEQILIKIDKERDTQRKGREELFKVCLVGYTNVGKSTLFNKLSSSSLPVEEKLFSTLDSTTRLVKLSPNKKFVLTDTIGFIRKLPHHLIASFRSTLEEVKLADLLLHLVDLSHPEYKAQISKVNEVLAELDSKEKPTVMVFNKIDLLDGNYPLAEVFTSHGNSASGKEAVFISAEKETGLDELKKILEKHLEGQMALAEIVLENSQLGFIPYLYQFGTLVQKDFGGKKAKIKIQGKKWSLKKLQASLGGANGKIKLRFV